ncbi:YebC/PmpR family DNA-binding transcriptional regulator [Nigerium massiliense]|uniref:YebC/PmpR family DNA-binding transcriptional regulator n=1 Tax=Nigerium massiliense TaxID=1522317 RepID=UPI00058E2EA3|nr:YebC/PmpR family DNA-binding transcriptional regulator [Nigerium massiliense]
MSGHSKWATTKHKKAAIDAKRGKLFANLIKKIEVAARVGGGDPGGNPTLYDAIQKAKKNSVPNDNIDRAVKRGSGAGSDAVSYDEITYEAYGPGGVAILINCLTDNRNRSASDIKVAITRHGGTVADMGSVARVFDRKGVVEVKKVQQPEEKKAAPRTITEDDLLEATIEADAEEINDGDDVFEIISEVSDMVEVRKAVQAAGIDYESADLKFIPQFTQPIESKEQAEKLFKLLDAIEDVEDVEAVYSNEDVPDEMLAALDA